MTRDHWIRWHLARRNEHLLPSDVEEIAWPALTEKQIRQGLTIDQGMRPPATLDDDIQAYASCVGQWRVGCGSGDAE